MCTRPVFKVLAFCFLFQLNGAVPGDQQKEPVQGNLLFISNKTMFDKHACQICLLEQRVVGVMKLTLKSVLLLNISDDLSTSDYSNQFAASLA